MKNYCLILVSLFSLVIFNCNSGDDTDCCSEEQLDYSGNNLAYFKVDYLSNEFQGGMFFSFDDTPSNNFDITTVYNAPSDFGSVQLYFEPLNELIFDGTIIWMGLGEMQYPNSLMEPNNFETISQPVPLPNESLLEEVLYDEYAYYPEPIDYSQIWGSINSLGMVKAFRDSNPNSQVKFFLYTPSVGVGDPNDWYWLVLLKN